MAIEYRRCLIKSHLDHEELCGHCSHMLDCEPSLFYAPFAFCVLDSVYLCAFKAIQRRLPSSDKENYNLGAQTPGCQTL